LTHLLPTLLQPGGKPELAIGTELVIIYALGVRISFEGERLEYSPEYILQHLSVCLSLLM
jgi:hypothetical protein